MSKLTKAARGQECTVRLYPHCNFDISTTVFAHAPSSSKGTSIKSPDWWGADCCSACHDIIDRRKYVDDISDYDLLEAFMRGIFETHHRRIEQGLIKI